MKKSKALMRSYIAFLTITIFVDLFTCWEGMEQVSLAATVAGAFFSLADLASCYISSNLLVAETIREKILAHIDFCDASLETEANKFHEMEEAIDLLRPYADKHDRAKYIISESKPLLEQAQKNMEDMRNIFSNNDSWLQKADKMINNVNNQAKVERRFLIAGFVSFFILLTFDKVVNIIAPHGALVTVIAFLIIVLTYHLRDELEEKAKEKKTEVQNFILEQQRNVAARKAELDNFPIMETAKEVLEKIRADIQQSEANENG